MSGRGGENRKKLLGRPVGRPSKASQIPVAANGQTTLVFTSALGGGGAGAPLRLQCEGTVIVPRAQAAAVAAAPAAVEAPLPPLDAPAVADPPAVDPLAGLDPDIKALVMRLSALAVSPAVVAVVVGEVHLGMAADGGW